VIRARWPKLTLGIGTVAGENGALRHALAAPLVNGGRSVSSSRELTSLGPPMSVSQSTGDGSDQNRGRDCRADVGRSHYSRASLDSSTAVSLRNAAGTRVCAAGCTDSPSLTPCPQPTAALALALARCAETSVGLSRSTMMWPSWRYLPPARSAGRSSSTITSSARGPRSVMVGTKLTERPRRNFTPCSASRE
jgi:hypothetical protein